jgi:ubiquinone/menaquinone biosynthesis C-methylase UbiE
MSCAPHVASFREFKLTPMSRANPVDDVGRLIPALSSALRPHPHDELREWGGPPLVRHKRVLDLGCGDGRLALGVAPYAKRVDGIDPDPEAIAAAKTNARKAGVRNVRFAAGAAQRLPYPDATFDVVILSWTL